MASWAEIEAEAPDLAQRVHRRFDMGINKALATLRKDGSPRISATELEFLGGEITLGMMGGSMKLLDVLRDPRIALHSPTIDAPENDPSWPGDAKLAGRLVRIPDPPDNTIEGAAFFRIDITELALTYVGEPADHLVIEAWHPGRGASRAKRY